MDGLNSVFGIASNGMAAETTRIKASAENMANANVVTGNPDEAFKPQYPIFKTIQANAMSAINGDQPAGGVQVTGTYESQVAPTKRYEPNNPVADKDGYVYQSQVNHMEEMANMISAARSYEINLEMINTTKQMVQRTLHVGE